MTVHDFFANLWSDYIKITPQAEAIRKLFLENGETVINDHVAFRTFSDCAISLEPLKAVIESLGYKAVATYRFEEKKLNAVSFEHSTQKDAPKIFLSELQTHELSQDAQSIIKGMTDQIPTALDLDPSIFWRGRLWTIPTKQAHQTLVGESEYAAWLSTIGLRVNHFTVSINKLNRFEQIEQVNQLLKESGFAMNTVGGEVKGSPELLLEQSSTMADKITLTFQDGEVSSIPSCFYEFAKRYPDASGDVFEGFIEGNADKIFESTNAR
jgi:hypothetical protein